ncbi:MAG TPA: hypothetical protein VFE78_01635, partial [Gemmataceae bacterium]|nr:hypothetical protein [Gemmataceae bacterium]
MARSRARWRRRLLAGATLLLLMAVVGGGVALHRKHARARALAALQANNRGVGHLEQFDNERAIVDFEEAARLAPGWLPAQINLGIALLNTDRKPELERAKQVFEGVLAKEPDN